MYWIRTNHSKHPVAYQTLEGAIAKLQLTFAAQESRGCSIVFNDRLEYEVSLASQPIELIWIEDAAGLKVISKDAALDC